ncbi:TPA: hypothetical protein UMV35_000879 [Stenotrophomonas maltophilia]|uniref:hypothetical protein n=1 Tax=Stenotrophomonas sp. GD03680 TaxID=2975365 RepID=UPI0018D4CDEA|nr:hypothetical protein [Stenotrophomonas sp. GD03680]MBH1593606.1 hypothetical protein [Stenotrophomonas maltophilia]MDH2022497.1 hypothetical protein [Stenotrophomonas sp. GD03680]HEL3748620.1 hypothetical protein [Stenotrophomonas maltophilia]HEL7729630.1 hypothetical protein [Stenotrophomonas maltophilia]
MTDLSTIVAAARTIDIKHPATDAPVGLVLTILPDSHPQVRAASRKLTNERMLGRGKVTAEKIEAGRIDMLVASVGGWEWQGDLNFHGEKPFFEEKTLRQLFKELPWVCEQVDAALGDRAEFFRGTEQEAG